ncbi:hypothetical protein ACFY12_25375 [Streptomyces sp. NPDC001339]|uniref:hypothetical protein n=1 Tax=Streptomyces sp. NPDC001339 TaxID=3364563 RepID=UPI0036A77A77
MSRIRIRIRITGKTRRTRTAAKTAAKTAMGAALAGAAVLGTLATAQTAGATSTGATSTGATSTGATSAAHHPVHPSSAHSGSAAVRTSGTPYVINHYGEENAEHGRAERSPANLVLSEFTSLHHANWKAWSAKRAVGTGEVTGTWCLDTCLDEPLKATVTLADPKAVDGRRIFTTFTLELADGRGTYDSEDLRGKRPLVTL